jgi:hypothetical protein
MSAFWEQLVGAERETDDADRYDAVFNRNGQCVHFPQDDGVVQLQIESTTSARVFAEVRGQRVAGAERRIRLTEDESPFGNGLRVWGGILALAASLDWHKPSRPHRQG